MEFSDALKRFRKERKLTQKQAAQLAGVAERVYQSYEYGKVVPTVTVLIALADALDVSLDYLAGRSDDPARRSSQPSVKGVDSMATWKDLSNFTWKEVQKMELTYAELNALPLEKLVVIAQEKLDRFKAAVPAESKEKTAPLIRVLESIMLAVTANLATDAIKSVEWKQLLINVINFLS